MIFIGGIGQGQRELDYRRAAVLCAVCGGYGRYQVIMTYTYFSFFFIPLFKWNRRYYVKMSCCGSLYELDPEVGKALARGEDAEIRQEHLHLLQRSGQNFRGNEGTWGGDQSNWAGHAGTSETPEIPADAAGETGFRPGAEGPRTEAEPDARTLKAKYGEDFRMRSCPHCGYQFVDHEKEFEFCPKCGKPLKKQEQEG